MHIDAGTVFQAKTVWCFVSSKALSIESEFEVLLAESLAFGKDSEDNAERTSVTQAKVGFFSGGGIAKEDGDGIISLRRLWSRGSRLADVARRSTSSARRGCGAAGNGGRIIFRNSAHQRASTRRSLVSRHTSGNVGIHDRMASNGKASAHTRSAIVASRVMNVVIFRVDNSCSGGPFFERSEFPNFRVQVCSVTSLEGNLGCFDTVDQSTFVQDSVGVVSNDPSKQEKAIISVVQVVQQVLFPHLLDGQRCSKLSGLPVVHDRFQFHELTVALQGAFGKVLLPSQDAHAAFDQRSGSAGERRIMLSVDFPPLFDFVFLGSGGSGSRKPQAAFAHCRSHGKVTTIVQSKDENACSEKNLFRLRTEIMIAKRRRMKVDGTETVFGREFAKTNVSTHEMILSPGALRIII